MYLYRNIEEEYEHFLESTRFGEQPVGMCAGMCITWLNDCLLEGGINSGGIFIKKPQQFFNAAFMAQRTLIYNNVKLRKQLVEILNKQNVRLNQLNKNNKLLSYSLASPDEITKLVNGALARKYKNEVFGLFIGTFCCNSGGGHAVAFFNKKGSCCYFDPNEGVSLMNEGENINFILDDLNSKLSNSNYKVSPSYTHIIVR